jgi:hypothetical protein
MPQLFAAVDQQVAASGPEEPQQEFGRPGDWFFQTIGLSKRTLWRVLDHCGQATKGAWGMSWRQKAMTGVEDCENLGVAVKQALIPGFPNQQALNP